jgi:hypothetical protein
MGLGSFGAAALGTSDGPAPMVETDERRAKRAG